jgi:RNA methyltransferase, TrmH family
MTKNWQKLVKNLHQKKYRQIEGLFLVEGTKSVYELLQSNFLIKAVFYTQTFEQTYPKELKSLAKTIHTELTTAEILAQVGTLQSNDGALAVVQIPINQVDTKKVDYLLALSDIRDPGNLGAIIRIADWYGISQILCSETTVDWYNPKVIIASMGSFLRVTPYYCDLANYLQNINNQELGNKFTIYGMLLAGQNLHKTQFYDRGIIVIGNESNGIAADILPLIDQKITIHRFGEAESLNAAMATTVVCDNLRRQVSTQNVK